MRPVFLFDTNTVDQVQAPTRFKMTAARRDDVAAAAAASPAYDVWAGGYVLPWRLDDVTQRGLRLQADGQRAL